MPRSTRSMKSSSPLQILSKICIRIICILIWKQTWAKYDLMVKEEFSKTFGFCTNWFCNVQAHDDPSSWAGLWTRHHGNVQVQRRLSHSKKIFAIYISATRTRTRTVKYHTMSSSSWSPLSRWTSSNSPIFQLLGLMVINIFSSFLCLTINAV